MWEVVTVGGTPYSDIVNLEDIVPQIMSGMRLQRPAHCTQPIYDIMSSCWETIPQHRPLFLEITDQLQSLNTAKMVQGRERERVREREREREHYIKLAFHLLYSLNIFSLYRVIWI